MRACKHTNACIDERRLVRSNIWTHEHARGQTDRQTDRRTDGLTDGLIHTPSRTRARTHTNDSMLTRSTQVHTHGRKTYAHMFVWRQTPKYKHRSWNLQVRSKKLEVRTNISTHEHARGQTDGRT